MSRLKAAYQEMYLVTKNVYQKVLDCIDESTRRSTEDLNMPDEEEFEERRPSEDFFDDLAHQDIQEGIQPGDVPIQESEQRVQDYGRQRVLRPMLTYQPDLPPIREALRRPEIVRGLPTLSKSTFPQRYYLPTGSDMAKQVEIIRRPQVPLPPPRPALRYEPPGQVEYSDYDDELYYASRPSRQSESSQTDFSRPSTPMPRQMVRQRPPVRVSYQDEGLETIQDCARGVSSSICQGKDVSRRHRDGGFQCDLCGKILSTKHSLNRHTLRVHKSASRESQSQTPSSGSFNEWERPSSSSTPMETAALPERRKRAVEEYETDEDIPLSKYQALRKRRERQNEPEGSGKKDNFETWQ